MSARLHSAVYEGVVRHRRSAPRPHAFRYRMAQLYLDLDEIDAVLTDRGGQAAVLGDAALLTQVFLTKVSEAQ